MCVETDGIESDQNGMQNSRHNRIKDVGDEHDSFDQKKEDGQHGNDDVEVGDTVQPSLNQSCAGRPVREEHSQFAPW